MPADATAYDWSDDLALALELADAADELTMARFGASDLVVTTKPDLTPVSEADQGAERALRERLSASRPSDAILGEEYGATGSGSRVWIIDPIDGTKNYVRGVPVWATLIALVQDGEPVVGVASAPALARRWWAATGSGAWATALGDEPRRLTVSAVADIADASLSISSQHGWHDRASGLTNLQASTWRQRAYGDFWSHLLVAEGAVDIAAEPELAPHDMAALIPIVREAGGRITGLDGSPAMQAGAALTTNGRLHDAVIAMLAPGGS